MKKALMVLSLALMGNASAATLTVWTHFGEGELGIPAIVAVPGVTMWLRDGDWVELNGSTGDTDSG